MKEMIKRALRTFFQAAAGYMAVNITAALGDIGGDLSVIKQAFLCLCVSAVAAGLAAVMNMPRKSDNDG